MTTYKRVERIAGADKDGSFRMTLATDGEASDGHILNIAGGDIPERMPLLVSHMNDPQVQVGSITQPVKRARAGRLEAMGNIELEGEGAQRDARRDLFHMIEQGHVGAVSIRWDADPEHVVARTDLPKDHPAFVDSRDANLMRTTGLFFEKWRALEGSIVGVGADPQALIARAQHEDTPEEARAWYRGMVDDEKVEAMESLDASCSEIEATAAANVRIAIQEALTALPMAEVRAAVEEVLDFGAAEAAHETRDEGTTETSPAEAPSCPDGRTATGREANGEAQAKEPARAEEAFDFVPGEIVEEIRSAIAEHDAALQAEMQDILDAARGVVK